MPSVRDCIVSPFAPTSKIARSAVGLLMTVANTVAAQRSRVPMAFACDASISAYVPGRSSVMPGRMRTWFINVGVAP